MRQGGEPQGVQVVRQGEPTPYHCNFNPLSKCRLLSDYPKAACTFLAIGRYYSRSLTPSFSACSSASVLSMRSWLNASISKPCTILYSPFSQVTGKPNMVSAGMPYEPSEGTPMVTHLPLVPSTQSRMWSMAALAAPASHRLSMHQKSPSWACANRKSNRFGTAARSNHA